MGVGKRTVVPDEQDMDSRFTLERIRDCTTASIGMPWRSSMSKGQKVGKFTCLASDSEFRGIIRGFRGSDVDIEPDPNYRHMVLPSPSRQTLKIETYPTPCGDNLEHDDTKPVPRLDDNGRTREIWVGAHIRVTGSWCTDNHVHEEEVAVEPRLVSYRGAHQVWIVKTEFHPYFPSSLQLIHPLQPGEVTEQTLTICAPLFTQVYSYTYLLNILMSYAYSNRDCHVVQESVMEDAVQDWFIEAPPLPPGGVAEDTHWLTIEEQIHRRDGEIREHWIIQKPHGFWVRVAVRGTDVLNPSRFQATYRASWKLRTHARHLAVSVSHNPVPLDQLIQVTVTAKDAHTGDLIAGRVAIDSPGRKPTDPPEPPEGHPTNIPFPYIFRARVVPRHGSIDPTGSVTAPGYPAVYIEF
jgi:hypothetical protein